MFIRDDERMTSQSYEKMREYYKRHPEQYERHKQISAINNAKYRKLNPEKWHMKVNARNRRKILQRRQEILELLGNKCSNPNCPIPRDKLDARALQIDHINGHGNQEKKLFYNSNAHQQFILKQIKLGSKDYQLLCANCNWLKRFENNECSQKEHS